MPVQYVPGCWLRALPASRMSWAPSQRRRCSSSALTPSRREGESLSCPRVNSQQSGAAISACGTLACVSSESQSQLVQNNFGSTAAYLQAVTHLPRLRLIGFVDRNSNGEISGLAYRKRSVAPFPYSCAIKCRHQRRILIHEPLP